jgi:fatty-acid desaturase
MPLLPARAKRENLRPEMLVAIVLIHIVALAAAPFTFSWPGMVAFLVMGFATGCLGITLCYHRLLSHRSYKANRALKYFLMLCGTLSMEGDPTWWTATHRLHHRESDQEMDPHSPRVSFAWSHILWLFFMDPRLKDQTVLNRFVPDLVNDPWAKFLVKYFLPVNVVFLLALYGLGYAMAGPKMALSMLVWGGFARIVWVWHSTWFVNSVTHIWGYRNFETKDDSRNIWWVALITFGEGWHNNHHANPSAARSGYRWWEFDVTYAVIKILKSVGLVWNVLPMAPATPVPAAAVVQLPIPEKTRVHS